MKLVTWNVNSLKIRMPRVLEFLELHAPDVVCLQETKSEPAAFPALELEAAVYQAVHHSAGRWAGVAVLARRELSIEEGGRGLTGEPGPDEARWVEARVEGLRVISTYVINGREVGSPFFADKLRFLEAAADRVAELREAGEPVALAGDFNVTRDDRDVYDPAAFEGSTHVTPEERAALEAVLDRGGLIDAYRELHDGEQFTCGTTVRATSTAGWACGSTTCCCRMAWARRSPRATSSATFARAQSPRTTRRW